MGIKRVALLSFAYQTNILTVGRYPPLWKLAELRVARRLRPYESLQITGPSLPR